MTGLADCPAFTPPAPIDLAFLADPLPAQPTPPQALWRQPYTVKRLKVAGSRQYVDVVPGLYWDEGAGLGTYYSADGTTYLCNGAAASAMARRDGVPYRPVDAGKHTGGVLSVNYTFDPAQQSRRGETEIAWNRLSMRSHKTFFSNPQVL